MFLIQTHTYHNKNESIIVDKRQGMIQNSREELIKMFSAGEVKASILEQGSGIACIMPLLADFSANESI